VNLFYKAIDPDDKKVKAKMKSSDKEGLNLIQRASNANGFSPGSQQIQFLVDFDSLGKDTNFNVTLTFSASDKISGDLSKTLLLLFEKH
jgi:hypothetical protein